MHQSSMYEMCIFRDKYLDTSKKLKIYDLGSRQVGKAKTYRELFDHCDNWQYIGVDMEPGENVDMNMADWNVTSECDVVISGQMLEHTEWPWTIMQMIQVALKPKGLACIIAPSSGPEHKYPIDCYRFFPDGMRSLAGWAGLNVVEAYISECKTKAKDGSHKWKDCVLVASK